MNVFIIPSWYPSATNPSYGIFIKEQIEMMAQMKSDWIIGVSLWGQGDDEKLLWANGPVTNIGKIARHLNDKSFHEADNNLAFYYTPALSWTKRFRKGNLAEIIRCNEINFNTYRSNINRCDLISVQASYPGILIGSHLAQKYDLPLHLHVRLGGFMFEHLLNDLGSMVHNFLTSIKRADLITVTSRFQKQSLGKWIENAAVIYNPVDTDFFSLDGLKGEGIVAIGRLEKEKGFDLLLDAISGDQTLNILGDGSMRKALQKNVRSKGREGVVNFLGEGDRENVRNQINKASFLVLPSRFETFGNVLLEAMACGKPVVATRCGGTEEIVTSETGILCEPSTAGLKEGIEALVSNLEDFDASVIRASVIRKFGKKAWMERLENSFKSIV